MKNIMKLGFAFFFIQGPNFVSEINAKLHDPGIEKDSKHQPDNEHQEDDNSDTRSKGHE